ncbi:MAG: enoyl-CoA hydratase-related protein [Actinomycetota bacterium]
MIIATITLARPPVNALNLQLCLDIAASFTEVGKGRDDVSAIIFTGEGKCFCAGKDVKVADDEPQQERAAALAAAVASVYHSEVPVIAAVNGPAIGAGFRFVLQTDIVVASSNASFSMPEIDHGLNPSIGTMLRGFNQYQAREIGFTGRKYSAEEMVKMGLLRDVQTPEGLIDEARSIATVLAAKSPLALRAAKRSANEVELMFRNFETAFRVIESKA